MEEWKKIKGLEDYQISNMGRVRSLKRGKSKILKPYLSGPKRMAYKTVFLYKNGLYYRRKIHILVAEHFLSKRPYGLQVSHINENHHDNRADNLCYESIRDNNNRPLAQKRHRLKYRVSKWGFRGIYKDGNRWRAAIVHQLKRYNTAGYDSMEEAALAYDKIAKKLLGCNAVTNKMLGLL